MLSPRRKKRYSELPASEFVSRELTAEERDYLKLLRQGDVLKASSMIVGSSGQRLATPHGVAIVSQACDIVRANRPNVIVGAIVTLGEQPSAAARDGERPRYVHLPALGLAHFIDLEYVQTMAKSEVLGLLDRPGVNQNEFSDVRRLSQAIGRRFSRLALPDEVYPWFEPLTKIAQEKFDKPNSPIGRAFGAVAQFRVEAPDWNPPGVQVTLHIVLRVDELSEFDEAALVEPRLKAWLSSRARGHNELAERLFPTSGDRPSGADRARLWQELGDALARICRPKHIETIPSVSEIVAEVSNELEFSLLKVRNSDELDLAHLSTPSPIAE